MNSAIGLLGNHCIIYFINSFSFYFLVNNISLDLQENLTNYYKIRDWDWNTGSPNQAKLKELKIL